MKGRLRHPQLTKSYTPKFFERFVQYKASDMKECTLRPLREDIGLRSPLTPYYTNDSESINAAIKEKVNYRKSEWPQFNAKMKELVNSLVQEAKKAIIGFGEFRIRDEYKHLVVPVEKWNRRLRNRESGPYSSFTLQAYMR